MSIRLSARVIAEIGKVAITLIEGKSTIKYLIMSTHQVFSLPYPPVKYVQLPVHNYLVLAPNAVETDNPKKHKHKKIITQAHLYDFRVFTGLFIICYVIIGTHI
jgi:hypothetical protein